MTRSFFFSSRRRHTISTRDWSSDVCSSDLSTKAAPLAAINRSHLEAPSEWARMRGCCATWRSEERRVGKECRSRGGTDQYEKKNDGLADLHAAGVAWCVEGAYLDNGRVVAP